jgi:hypothetical protein
MSCVHGQHCRWSTSRREQLGSSWHPSSIITHPKWCLDAHEAAATQPGTALQGWDHQRMHCWLTLSCVPFCCWPQVAARIAGRLKEERARLEARLEAQLEEERQVRGWGGGL